MKLNCAVIFISLLVLAIVLHAQEEIHFNHLSVESGLSDDEICTILQDSTGYIWVGSVSDGLYRYDGNSCDRYLHKNDDSNSIADNEIIRLCEDRLHKIWIGTAYGLSCLDPVTNKFTNYYFDKWTKAKQNNCVTAICSDKSGMLWVGTYTGLYKIDVASGKCANVRIAPDKNKSRYVRGIISTGEGRLFVAFDSTLEYSDDEGVSFKDAKSTNPEIQSIRVSSICVGKDDEIWIGSRLKAEVFAVDSRTFSVKHYIFDTLNPPTMDSHNDTHAIQVLNDSIVVIGEISIGGSGYIGMGLFLLNIYSNKTEKFMHNTLNPLSISNNGVLTICSDKQQTVWIGTTNGVNYFNTRQLKFQAAEPPSILDSAIFAGSAAQISNDDRGNLWVETFDNRIASYSSLNNVCTPSALIDKVKPLSIENSIWYIYPTGDSVLIGTQNGMELYNNLTKILQKSPALPPSLQILQLSTITSIIKDKQGSLWFGTWQNGVYRYNPYTKATNHYLFPGEMRVTNAPVNPINIICLTTDTKGNIWAGTREDGFCMIDPVSGEVKWNQAWSANTDTKPLGYVNDIFCDTNETIYIATSRKGILEFNATTGKIQDFTLENGLANDNVVKIIPWKNNYLWLPTKKGLSFFDRSTHKFRNYFKVNGLLADLFFSGCITRSGILLLTSNTCIQYLNPSTLLQKNIDIFPGFVSMQVNNKDYNYDLSKKIFLGYKDRIISFTFSAFDFINNAADKFAYKLEGLDEDWNYCGSRRYAEYTNLPGGDYALRLKVQASDGSWVETACPILLHIATPYWKTWWFLLLCGIATFALGYLVYYPRMRRKLEEERLRTRLARDLHDDIGSSLSSISILSDMATQKKGRSEEDSMKLFTKIHETSQKTLDSVSDMVWTFDPEFDLMDDLIARVRLYASEILESKEISYDFTAGNETGRIKMPMDTRKNFYLIFKEALNNLVKYSGCTHARISIKQINGNMELEISDNGIGFSQKDPSGKDEQVVRSGNGLKNMKQRAIYLHGNITIDTKPGEGTTVRLIFPYA
ncbi:MAG TPA: two-component regulator propeller domain-containing protein [Bacteroidia bacterium]|nr:two-component regulator propeller domain-containing protein [Bacteroidia bacterium]